MLSRKNKLHDFTPSQRLYCVWIRAQEGANAPLVSVWIDLDMSAFATNTAEASDSASAEPLVASAGEAWAAEDDDPGGAGAAQTAVLARTPQPLAMTIDSSRY